MTFPSVFAVFEQDQFLTVVTADYNSGSHIYLQQTETTQLKTRKRF